MKSFPIILSTIAAVGLCMAPATYAAVYTVTTAADSGPGSLRSSILAAGSGDTVVFSSTLAGQIIYLTSGELLIGQNITIDASALSGGIIISGSAGSRVMEIGNVTVTINSLTLTNGYASGDFGGGLLLDDSTTALTARNCVFCGNSAEFGGGITTYGTLTLNNCLVSNNVANVYGGGIFCYGVGVMLNNCTFSSNSVTEGGGGAIESEFSGLTLENCTVSGNVASIFGGGIDSEDEGTLYVTNCIFMANSSGTAGALSVQTPATLINCTFSDNLSTNGAGGGIANYSTLALSNCTLSNNSVTNGNSQGGGLVNSGILTMNNCTLSGNSAPNGSGGGIDNLAMLTAYNCTLSGNSAADGNGGGLASLTATNFLVNCTVYNNYTLAGSGGGIYCDSSSTLALTNTIVAQNAAYTGNPDVYGAYSGVANFIGGNPQLAGLGYYGGTTETIPPEFGSPVIDAGTDWVTNLLATDQRGYPRRAGAHVDIGAVEAQTAPANNRPILKNPFYATQIIGFPGSGDVVVSTFTFSFTNVPNADFTILASTNLVLPLADWTVLGNARGFIFPGQYQYSEVTGSNPQQFYRVVSP